MFMQLQALGRLITTIYYLNIDKKEDSINVVVVGEAYKNDVRTITYESFKITLKGSNKETFNEMYNHLVKSFTIIKGMNGGCLNLDTLTAIFRATIKPKNSVVGSNLVYVYDRMTTLNGFFASETTLIGISGYSFNGLRYNMFVADIKAGEVLTTPEDIPERARQRMENSSFEKGTSFMDLEKACHYYNLERKSIMKETYDNKEYKSDIVLTAWITKPLDKKTKKEIKKRLRKELKEKEANTL